MRIHVVVRGRVQGVGFRWFVREKARELQLAGWVKNRDDGCVEVVGEGSATAIDSLRQELLRGPRGAVVAGLDDLNDDASDLPRSFTIVR